MSDKILIIAESIAYLAGALALAYIFLLFAVKTEKDRED